MPYYAVRVRMDVSQCLNANLLWQMYSWLWSIHELKSDMRPTLILMIHRCLIAWHQVRAWLSNSFLKEMCCNLSPTGLTTSPKREGVRKEFGPWFGLKKLKLYRYLISVTIGSFLSRGPHLGGCSCPCLVHECRRLPIENRCLNANQISPSLKCVQRIFGLRKKD